MKTIGDNKKELQVRINQHIYDCKTGISTCKFPCHVYHCVIKNYCLVGKICVFTSYCPIYIYIYIYRK